MSSFSTTDALIGPARGDSAQVFAYCQLRGRDVDEHVRSYVEEVYRLAPLVGLDPALVVAQSIHETTDPQNGHPWASFWWRTRRNPAGMGITDDPSQHDASPIYETGADAARAQMVHLWLYAKGEDLPEALHRFRHLNPRWEAAISAGFAGVASKLADLTGRWGTDADYATKIAKVAARVYGDQPSTSSSQQGQGQGQHQPPAASKVIILNYGHRDFTGGGADGERAWTPKAGRAIRDGLRAAGYTVHVVQEFDDGRDGDPEMLQGTLDDVGRTAVKIDREHGPAIAYISVHHDGTRNAPGFHAIPPDGRGLKSFATGEADHGDTWGDNPLDIKFARALAKHVDANTRLGLRNSTEPGVMSERVTGVGGNGWRLSEMHETLPLRGHCARIVTEAGSVGHEGNKAEVRSADFPGRYALGIVAAVEEIFGKASAALPPPPPPDAQEFPRPGLTNDGRPNSDLLAELFGTVQAFNPDPEHGVVSTVWRDWCFANNIYPAMTSVIALADEESVYTFANGLLIHGKGQSARVITRRDAGGLNAQVGTGKDGNGQGRNQEISFGLTEEPAARAQHDPPSQGDEPVAGARHDPSAQEDEPVARARHDPSTQR